MSDQLFISSVFFQKKYTYNALPTFDLVYYHQWAKYVQNTFHKCKSSNFLLPSTEKGSEYDSEIKDQVMSFLIQSIPI